MSRIVIAILIYHRHKPVESLRSLWSRRQSRDSCILWNPTTGYFGYKNTPLDRILSQMNPIHILATVFEVHFTRLAFPSIFSPPVSGHVVFVPRALHNPPIASWTAQTVEMLIMQVAPPHFHFFPLEAKYFAQKSILRHSQYMQDLRFSQR
jgi:hypothetical protein